MGKVIKLNFSPDFIAEGKKIFEEMNDHDRLCLYGFVSFMNLKEIKAGVEGKETGPFYAMVNKLKKEK